MLFAFDLLFPPSWTVIEHAESFWVKTLAREKAKTTMIARKLKQSVAATYQQATELGVMLGGGRGRKGT